MEKEAKFLWNNYYIIFRKQVSMWWTEELCTEFSMLSRII